MVLFAMSAFGQRGKDGSMTITANPAYVNEYTYLTVDASAGNNFLFVWDSGMNSNGRFSTNLQAGDLILIIQMQGAELWIDPTPIGLGFDFTWPSSDDQWGQILNYNQCGLYEFAEVTSAGGGTINLRCDLQNTYSSVGHTQIVRIPRYTDLTINAGASLTADPWNGQQGGIVAVEVEGTTTINGNIDVSAIGFRGGSLVGDNVTSPGNGQWGGPMADDGAEKGEGIGGYHAEYDAVSSRYMKGAAGNAGGGGCGENSGGGGGGNGGAPGSWVNGVGVPDPAYNNAWDQETPPINGIVSSGGGRGGYTFSDQAGDPYNDPLNNNGVWGGDGRRDFAPGLGGRPVDYSTGRLFFGGGGGAGDQNNGDGGEGGRGAGMVYIMGYGDVVGSGSIIANGQDGFSSDDSGGGFPNYQGNDGAGGGGAGGTVVVNSYTSVTGVTIVANGGDGGDNLMDYWNPPLLDAYGPGGGGGGGYIAVSAGAPPRTANGGAYGISVTDAFDASGNLFPPNGATSGGVGSPNETITNWDVSASGTTICAGNTATLTASITGTAPGGTQIVWYDSDVNGTLLFTGASYTTPVLGTTTTYWVGTCPGWYLLPVTVTVTAAPDAGTNGTLTICATGAPTDLFNELGGTPDTGGTWSGPSGLGGGDAGTFDPSSNTAGTYTYTVSLGGGCPDAMADVVVTITPAPDAGSNGTHDFCSTDAPADLINDLGGSPQAGGSWSGPSGLGGGDQGTFDPSSNLAGTYTYTVTAAGCAPASADVVVTIETAPDAGTPGAVTYCDAGPGGDLFTELGGSPNGGGSWSPALTSGTGVFDPLVDAGGTYTYTVAGTVCSNAQADVVVTIETSPDAGNNGTHDFCSTDAPADLINDLVGSPDAGGSWTGPSGLGGGDQGTFDPSSNTAGTYTYTVNGTVCANASADVVVTIETAPDAGSPGTLNICATGSPTNLLGQLGGAPDAGGSWTGPSVLPGGDMGTFDPTIHSAGVYTYTVNGTVCANATATVTVTITSAPDAGTNGTHVFCSTDTPADLFNDLGGTPDNGGTWSGPSGLAGGDLGTFDPSSNTAGTYTYTVTAVGCVDATATVDVTINTAPVAGSNGSITLCDNGSATDLFNQLGGTPDNGGAWTGPSSLAGGDLGTFDPTTDLAGTYTYTVTGTAPCLDATATVDVAINAAPDAGTAGALTICSSDAPTDLFNELGGTPDVGGSWSPGLTSGTGVFDPAVDPGGTYTYTVTGTAPCADAMTDVVVTVNTVMIDSTNYVIQDANCGATDGSITGITVSGGTTPYSFDWSGTGTPTADYTSIGPGSYTLTVTDAQGCTAVTGAYNVNTLGGPVIDDSNIVIVNEDCGMGNGSITGITTSGGTTPYIFDWSGTATATEDHTGIGAGSYTLTVTDDNGCTAVIGPYSVLNNPGPAIDSTAAVITDATCGNPDGSITGITVSGGTTPYTYDWSGTATGSPDLTAVIGGSYTLTVTDAIGCTATSGPYVINDLGSPTASFTHTPTVAEVGQQVDFVDGSSADVTGWTWDFAGLGTDNSQNPSFTFTAPGTYTVCLDVVNAVPCGAQYCSDVVVVETIEFEVWVPNVFSPNGDGENDELMVFGQGIESMIFYVYDRWGELVYEGRDPNSGWDGTFNGGEMDPATFVYYVEVTYTNGQVESAHGNFTLVR